VNAKVRIIRLEARIPRGCDVCRRWSETVIVDARGGRSRPEACPACGRAVPMTATVELAGVALADI